MFNNHSAISCASNFRPIIGVLSQFKEIGCSFTLQQSILLPVFDNEYWILRFIAWRENCIVLSTLQGKVKVIILLHAFFL